MWYLLQLTGSINLCSLQIRIVVEEGLNLLPHEKCTVTTPSGESYEGVRYMRGNCGVSIMRSGKNGQMIYVYFSTDIIFR